MTNKFKTLLKTSAALATLFAGSQSWGADATTYITGAVDGAVRRDIIHTGAAGDFNGFAYSPASVKTLYITFVKTADAAAEHTNPTEVKTFPESIKDIWLLGDAAHYNTIVANADEALPTPAEGTTIHFMLTTAPAGAPTAWFQAALPSSCTVVVEKDSADPFLGAIVGATASARIFKLLTLGSNITLPNGSALIKASIERHKSVKESEASSKSTITMAVATTFSKPVKGVSLAGAFGATFNEGAELIDPNANVSTYTVGAGKKLTITGINAAPSYPVSTSITLGVKSSFTATSK